MPQLLTYVWDVRNKEIKEIVLFCKEHKVTTKSDDIFKLLEGFMISAEIS